MHRYSCYTPRIALSCTADRDTYPKKCRKLHRNNTPSSMLHARLGRAPPQKAPRPRVWGPRVLARFRPLRHAGHRGTSHQVAARDRRNSDLPWPGMPVATLVMVLHGFRVAHLAGLLFALFAGSTIPYPPAKPQ